VETRNRRKSAQLPKRRKSDADNAVAVSRKKLRKSESHLDALGAQKKVRFLTGRNAVFMLIVL
jgi:hypothetical protein